MPADLHKRKFNICRELDRILMLRSGSFRTETCPRPITDQVKMHHARMLDMGNDAMELKAISNTLDAAEAEMDDIERRLARLDRD